MVAYLMPEQLHGLDGAWTREQNTEYLLRSWYTQSFDLMSRRGILQTIYPQTPPHQLPTNM
jgi:hypothetical protein